MYIEYIVLVHHTFGDYIRVIPNWEWFIDLNNKSQYLVRSKRWL